MDLNQINPFFHIMWFRLHYQFGGLWIDRIGDDASIRSYVFQHLLQSLSFDFLPLQVGVDITKVEEHGALGKFAGEEFLML
jgi:hypothetical protein